MALPATKKAASQLEGDEALVYAAVNLEAKPVDVIVREIGISAPRVLAALLILLTKGLVRELPGKPICKAGRKRKDAKRGKVGGRRMIYSGLEVGAPSNISGDMDDN